MSSLIERLRDAVQRLRRTPMKIADIAPLLTQSADRIEALERELDEVEEERAAMDSLIAEYQASERKLEHEKAELVAALGRVTEVASDLYSAWENGVHCYEDPEDCAGYLGNAFVLADEDRCIKVINEAEAIVAGKTPAAPGAADQGGLNKRDPFSTAALLINEWNETPQDVDEWGNRAAEALGYLAQELHKEIVTRCAVANREKENG